jgi:hypothetical protein
MVSSIFIEIFTPFYGFLYFNSSVSGKKDILAEMKFKTWMSPCPKDCYLEMRRLRAGSERSSSKNHKRNLAFKPEYSWLKDRIRCTRSLRNSRNRDEET